MATRIQCPACRARYTLSGIPSRRAVFCPKCGAEVRLPPTERPPAGPPVRPPDPPRPSPPPLPRAGPPGPAPAGGPGETAGSGRRPWTEDEVVGRVLILGLIALAVFLAAAGLAKAALIPLGLLVVVTLLLGDAEKRRRRNLCRRCGQGQMRPAGRAVVKEERAYGLVSRTSRAFVRGWGQGGRPVGGWATERWEERVPVVRTTYRVTTRCDRCGAEATREEIEEDEDFDRE